jgi:uncharacterized protein YkwD
MKYSFWLLILLAGSAAAQWRHFGDGSPGNRLLAEAPPSLANEMVAAHNAVRARVGGAPLRWSDELAKVAQQWADGLIASGQLAHSHNPKLGENLYEIRGAPASSATVVKSWADEVRDYDYGSNSCKGVCGHYTQIVWSDTKEVGCAVAKGGSREVWVCEYDPPGNWVGKKPY